MLFSGTPKRLMAASPRLLPVVIVIVLGLVALPERRVQTSGFRKGVLINEAAPTGSIRTLAQNLTSRQLPAPATAMNAAKAVAAGDFDEDGNEDFVVGYGSAADASLIVYSNSYNGDPEKVGYSSLRRGSQPNTATSGRRSWVPGQSLPINDSPDFIVASDFNEDGHTDIATASRGGNGFYLLFGDGHGNFPSTRFVATVGRVTTMSAKTRNGSSCLAVGLTDQTSSSISLFKSTNSFPGDPAELISLQSQAGVIAFTEAASNNSFDLLVGSGRELLMVRSQNGDIIRLKEFASSISSLIAGHFYGESSNDVAVATESGEVWMLVEIDSESTLDNVSFLRSWSPGVRMARVRLSGQAADDLAVIDPVKKSVDLLVDNGYPGLVGSFSIRDSLQVELDGEAFSAAAVRSGDSALNDLVILKSGEAAPTIVHPQAAMTFVVLNTNDSGADSLRQAILNANANPGTDTINFAIGGGAPHTINLLSPLPAITEAVTINGNSQPDFAGTPVVELNGLNAGAGNGLTISTSSCAVRGLVINRFSGNGIAVSGGSNVIEGNYIGTGASGGFASANTLDGVLISAGTGNTIGGTTAAARNLLSGNRHGIQLSGGSGTQVRGNFIGTNAAGTGSVGNSFNGILIGASGNSIGAVGSASSNVVAFNGAAGIAVSAGNGNAILSNSIFLNGGLGIDLGPVGVTPNDTGDGDAGANDLQNFPVIDSASSVGTSTAVTGTLNSLAATQFRLEFFSNQMPNPSGFGEGQTFIGSVTVTTNASGNASFNPTFAVTVAPGQIVTATATSVIAGNTSEFSKAVQVGGVTGGTPADLSVITSLAPNPVETGSEITKTIVVTNAGPATANSVTVNDVLSTNLTFVSCNSTGGGVCGGTGNNRTITFPSLAPGSSAIITIVADVKCSVANGTVIGNTATVFSATTPDINPANNVGTNTTVASNPAPRIACPGNITQGNDLGQCSAVVNFFPPQVVDNCVAVSVVCTPSSGSSFSIGTTTVNCLATDLGGATASCSFTVTVNDVQQLTVSCPSNITVTATPGNCTPVVTFPAPVINDNCPGDSVVCAPPSGSSFPLGTTGVLCTATDSKGIQATCGFTITVNGAPLAVVRLENDASALEFGPVPAARKAKKVRKQKSRTFSVQNNGCLPLVLTFDSINRVGNDVNQGRIGDPDDRATFTLYSVDALGNDTELDIFTDVRINVGQKQNFKVRFHPLIPVVADDTRNIPASKVIPDLITSVLQLTQNAGPPIRISLFGHVETPLALTDPVNPRGGPTVLFTRSGDELIIEYTIYDPNLDVKKANYQFFDKRARPVATAIDVDLAELVRQSNFVRGQSFTIDQHITGARDHGDIIGVRVTVTDSESSDFAESDPSASATYVRSNVGIFPARISAPSVELPSGKPLSSNRR